MTHFLRKYVVETLYYDCRQLKQNMSVYDCDLRDELFQWGSNTYDKARMNLGCIHLSISQYSNANEKIEKVMWRIVRILLSLNNIRITA